MRKAAVILVIKDGMILGVSRRNSANKFGLPGGKLETNEEPIDAAKRECLEEAGITVHDAVFIYRRDEEPETPGGEVFHTYCFYALDWDGEPRPSEEGDVKWVSAAELTGELGAFAEYNTQTLKHLTQHFPEIILKDYFNV